MLYFYFQAHRFQGNAFFSGDYFQYPHMNPSSKCYNLSSFDNFHLCQQNYHQYNHITTFLFFPELRVLMLRFQKSAKSGKGRSLFAENKKEKKRDTLISHCSFLCSKYKIVTLKNTSVPKQIEHSREIMGTQQIKGGIFVQEPSICLLLMNGLFPSDA